MVSDRDHANLLRDLDEGDFVVLRALADWHEERGEMEMTLGYRWLAKYRKRPVMRSDHSRWWHWEWGGKDPSSEIDSRLPNNVVNVLPKAAEWHNCFPTRHEAYQSAAKGVGKWLITVASAGSPD